MSKHKLVSITYEEACILYEAGAWVMWTNSDDPYTDQRIVLKNLPTSFTPKE